MQINTQFDALDILKQASIPTVSRFTTIQGILIFILNVSVGLGVSLTIITTALGLFNLVTSGGDPKLVKKAYDTFSWSLIGMGFIIAAFAIKNISVKILGATLPDVPNF